MKQKLILDFETRSESPLKRTGGWIYSKHPSTKIICVGYGLKGEKRHVWKLKDNPELPNHFRELINNSELPVIAHNSFFEYCIFNNTLVPNYPELDCLRFERLDCTASRSSALALPRSLSGSSFAMDLRIQKDIEGRELILKYCKPRKPTKKDPRFWLDDPADWERIYEYCKNDIEVEDDLDSKLLPLQPRERQVWELDQKINARGFYVDREAAEAAFKLIEEEKLLLEDETFSLTDCELSSPRQVQRTREWLRANHDIDLEKLDAKTVLKTLIRDDIPDQARRILEIRKSISRASTAKYKRFLDKIDPDDGRVRDSLVYHGASTGRWTGSGVQPQNFPRGTLRPDEVNLAIEIIKSKDLELLRMLFEDPMETMSSCLRGMILPTPGKELFCGDLSQIEVRVLFWLATEAIGLKAFEESDIYIEMAKTIYNLSDEAWAALSKEEKAIKRQLGKQVILGSGFGMGDKKFKITCEGYAMDVSEELAKRAIYAYRNKYVKVKEFWKQLEQSAIYTVKTGKQTRVNKISWKKEGNFLFCYLPSGRRLPYFKPKVKITASPWGGKETLCYMGINPKTKQFTEERTYGGKICENIVQGVARDIMVEAMFRFEDAGYECLLTFHDEILTENEFGDLDRFTELMKKRPDWALDLPIESSCFTADRYKK